MFRKRLQLGLIHAAIAITLVPINSTLNRILIEDMGVLAVVVVLLFSPPYLFSFIQVAIGAFTDRIAVWGWQRTPAIFAGLLLCAGGLLLATRVALLLTQNFWLGIVLGLLTFGAWGMGFNLATVNYFALASELSGGQGRAKTTAVMFFIMIVGIILTAATLSRLLENYTPELLERAFAAVALIAVAMGILGLIGLEPRTSPPARGGAGYSLKTVYAEIRANPQVRRFFTYLLLMLAAVLGQDVMLEPFAARAFAMPVSETTRITSIWGTFYLLSLAAAGFLEGRVAKVTVARGASRLAILAFILVAASGALHSASLFHLGVVLLGVATGPATVSNLSLMLDLTVPGKIGLFIGAWGSASAFARLLGSLSTAIPRDLARLYPNAALTGYIAGFLLLAAFLLASLAALKQIDFAAFPSGAPAGESQPTLFERAALAEG
jgi:BCD family chlorophyll transporter-like MFS transporter